jgi:hypothetical protein
MARTKKWMKKGSKAHNALKEVLSDPNMVTQHSVKNVFYFNKIKTA